MYALFWQGDDYYLKISQEHGILEALSASLFACAGVFGVIRAVRLRTQLSFTFSLLMLMAAAREMDWHKAFTSDSILKTRFYLRAETPFYEKFVGLVCIALLIYCVWQLIKHSPEFIRRVLQLCPYASSVFLGLGMICTAKLLDSMDRILPFASNFKAQHHAYLTLIEESFEIAAAMIFFMLAAVLLKMSLSDVVKQEHDSPSQNEKAQRSE